MPWVASPTDNLPRFHRICLVAAFGLTVLWGLIYIHYERGGLVDEPGQMEAIHFFAATKPGIPQALPNLPGYHFLVVLLTNHQPTLTSARLVTLALSLAGLAAFAGAWRQKHGTHPGGATLLLALLPIMQPFTAMAYTDVPAMTFVFAAFWAHFAGRRALSALLLAGACLIRQTAILWAAYLLTLELLNWLFPRNASASAAPATAPASAPTRRAGFEKFIEETRWLWLLLVTAAAIVLYAGRLTLGRAHGNQFTANFATIHFAGTLLLLLGLPFWLKNARPMLVSYRQQLAAHRTRTLVVSTLAVGAALLFAITYTNPHIWNRELFWLEPPSTFVLLRNVPLVWIDRLPVLRALSGVVIVGAIAGLGWRFARQRFTRELWLLLPFGAALLLSNGLVEPRYLIPPCALGLLLLEPLPSELLGQIRWFAVLCLGQCALILPALVFW